MSSSSGSSDPTEDPEFEEDYQRMLDLMLFYDTERQRMLEDEDTEQNDQTATDTDTTGKGKNVAVEDAATSDRAETDRQPEAESDHDQVSQTKCGNEGHEK